MNKPDFSFEKRYWKIGYQLVIGVDEVGRGALAGPVVAGAAALKNFKNKYKKLNIKNNSNDIKDHINKILLLGINDSKKVSPQKREKLEKEIKKYFYWGIGEASVSEINKVGIVKATQRAMRKAVRKLQSSIVVKRQSFLLIDAFHVKYIPGIGLSHQKAIIKGDERSISIAAASIIAKVYRDHLMQKLSRCCLMYHWDKNKGYGTKEHQAAIRRFGVTKRHRNLFVRNFLHTKTP